MRLLPLLLTAGLVAVVGASTPRLAAAGEQAANKQAANKQAANKQAAVRELLARGKAALVRKDVATARMAFAQGLLRVEAGPARWRMLLGLALAHELEGASRDAVYAYRTFLKESLDAPAGAARPWKARRERALDDVLRLEQELLLHYARVDLQSDPEGATIVVDGRATPQRTPAVLYLPTGRHTLSLQRAKHQAAALTLSLEPGQRPLIYRRLEPHASHAPPPAPTLPPVLNTAPPQPLPAAPKSVTGNRDFTIAGGLTIATGGALLIAAGSLHSAALRDADEVGNLAPSIDNIPRDEQLRDRIAVYQPTFITGYIVGVAALATGVGLLVFDASAASDNGADVRVRLSPAGMDVAARF